MDRPLRALAADRGLAVGAAVAPGPLVSDPDYAATLRREFGLVTTENALKMARLRPSRHAFDFADADAIVGFAREHDMAVRGHTLLWHRSVPDWLAPREHTDRQLRDLVRRHVHTTVARYRGRVGAWDVVNEAVADDGSLRETAWSRIADGPRYLDRAFEWAREADPDAALFYNDYGAEGLGAKSDAVHDLVSGMLDRGVPIDGVGLQCHALGDRPDPEDVAANVERLRDLGLSVHVTELDVAFPRDDPPTDPGAAQAEYYRDLVGAALEAGAGAVVTWGVDDAHSWVRYYEDFPERYTTDPLLFDEGYEPKPAYDAVCEALR
ncbi:MAG: endo-1,4-beta-xylanase [Halobacteriales archaeon]